MSRSPNLILVINITLRYRYVGHVTSYSRRVLNSTRGNLRGCFQMRCTQSLVLINSARRIKFTVICLNKNDSCYKQVMNYNSSTVTVVSRHRNILYHKYYWSKPRGQINTSVTSPYLFTLFHFPAVTFHTDNV